MEDKKFGLDTTKFRLTVLGRDDIGIGITNEHQMIAKDGDMTYAFHSNSEALKDLRPDSTTSANFNPQLTKNHV